MSMQKENEYSLDQISKARFFWSFCFISIAVFWFCGMICYLDAWLEGTYDRGLNNMEPIRILIFEIISDVARFPSICIEGWASRHEPDAYFFIGYTIDSLLWSFLIIYLCRKALRVIAPSVPRKK